MKGMATWFFQVRLLVVEIDAQPDWANRFDQVGLVRNDEAGMLGVEDDFRDGVKHPIAKSAFEHANDAPNAKLCAMLPAKPRRKRDFVKNGSALVRCRGANHGCTVRAGARRAAAVCDPPRISSMQPNFGSVVRISCDQRRVDRLSIQRVCETMIDVAMMGFVRTHQQDHIA